MCYTIVEINNGWLLYISHKEDVAEAVYYATIEEALDAIRESVCVTK